MKKPALSKIGSWGQRAASAARPGNKIGMTDLGNRAIAQGATPSSNVGEGSNKSQYSTYFTQVPVSGQPTPILYNGDRLWARVTLVLETAGPVAVGQSSNLSPVLGGSGIQLTTNEPLTFDIAKGTRLYILSTSINRVKFKVEPIPWLEMLAGLLSKLVGKS